jgi:hypothetical protein
VLVLRFRQLLRSHGEILMASDRRRRTDGRTASDRPDGAKERVDESIEKNKAKTNLTLLVGI